MGIEMMKEEVCYRTHLKIVLVRGRNEVPGVHVDGCRQLLAIRLLPAGHLKGHMTHVGAEPKIPRQITRFTD